MTRLAIVLLMLVSACDPPCPADGPVSVLVEPMSESGRLDGVWDVHGTLSTAGDWTGTFVLLATGARARDSRFSFVLSTAEAADWHDGDRQGAETLLECDPDRGALAGTFIVEVAADRLADTDEFRLDFPFVPSETYGSRGGDFVAPFASVAFRAVVDSESEAP